MQHPVSKGWHPSTPNFLADQSEVLGCFRWAFLGLPVVEIDMAARLIYVAND
jgi:hypothetical protein